ncbi:hypothetical protein DYB26_008207, partial [Aphanomyces astaci]
NGWTVLIVAFALNLIVPVIAFVTHLLHRKQAEKAKAVLAKEAADLEASEGAGAKYKYVSSSVPFSLANTNATSVDYIAGDPPSVGWVQLVCYCLAVSFALSCAMLIPSFPINEKAFELTRLSTVQLSDTSYAVESAATTPLPASTRYLSIQGAFCEMSATILAPTGVSVLTLNYTISFDMEAKKMFDTVSGSKTIGCDCDNSVCRMVPDQSDNGLTDLVYFPWFQDADEDLIRPLVADTDPHEFTLRATFELSSSYVSATPVSPIPHLSFLAHYSYIEHVIDLVNVLVFALDLLVIFVWGYLTRKVEHKLPERSLISVILFVNFIATFPFMFVTKFFFPTSVSLHQVYLFCHAWQACSSGIWLLCLLFALDMQRKRVFGCRFYLVKLTLGAVVLSLYLWVYYSTLPYQWILMLNFFLAILVSTIFRGVMIDVRNKLRYQCYVSTRPEQLTARLLYVVAIAVTYVFFFVALTADPVPRVEAYLPKTVHLTDMSIQVMIRTATWILVIIFLPPSFSAPQVYYMRAKTSLPRLTDGSMHDFEMASLKQAVHSRGLFHSASNYAGWKAPRAFCVETACTAYNQSVAVYDEVVANAETGGYDIPSHAHFAADGLEFVAELFDRDTDTYGWVLKGEKKIMVVFRGTKSGQNAVTDLKYRFCVPTWATDETEGGLLDKTRVHTGFWEAYVTVRDDLKRILHELVQDMGEVQVYLTGHSLGGALATLAAFDLVTDNTFHLDEEVVLYTLGAPRVGNHIFATIFNKHVPNAYRICADGDAVVGAPKRSIQLAYFAKSLCYKHIGTAVLLSTRAKGVFMINPNIVERAFMAEFRNNVLAHLPPTYRHLLNKGVMYTMKPESVRENEATPFLYRRQSGCAVGNCECFPILFECSPLARDGLGECALSHTGWIVLIVAIALNLVVPVVAFLIHLVHKKSAKEVTGREDHVQTDLEATSGQRKYMINLAQFRTIVPDTVFGLDQAPKIFMETMNKGWVQSLCYGLVLAFILAMALLIPPFKMDESLYPLTRDTTVRLNRSAYRIASHSDTSVPPGIRYISIQGDFCGNASSALLDPNGKTALNVSYEVSFTIDSNSIFDNIHGHKVIGCVCVAAACRIDDEQSDDGYAPLVYFPWYQDALHPLDLQAQPHSFALSGVFQVESKFNRAATVHPIPHLAFIAHHSYIERITGLVDLGVFVTDVAALLAWIGLTRAANVLPERRLMFVMLVVNFLGSFPVLFVAQKLDPTASWQDTYFFMHAWSACASGIWLLCLLFALDMQRKRVFGCRFYLVKLTLGAVVLTSYMFLFYSATLPTQWIQLTNFFLAILVGSIFRGVMVDVRNKLRYASYADSRPQQLTARFLYTIALAVSYVFFFVALFADPVPRVTNYLPKTALLTDTAIQVITRSATWVLVIIFLPPLAVDPSVYYTRAASALPRLTHASNREFELAHLKQATHSGGTTTTPTYHLSTLSWQAPQAFCVETACAMYNQAIGVYDEPVLNKATGRYDMASLEHFHQDGLEFVAEVFDKATDTYGWVSRGDKRVVVTFRGTQSAANTVTDLKYFFAVPTWECHDKPDLDKTRVHVGFWTAYITVQHQLKTILRDTLQDMGDVQIYFTGILGGALATLAAFDIATDATFVLKEEVVLYSFGAPRVGNHVFARAFKEYVPNAYRVCNDGDAIVGAPKRSVQLAYFVKSLCYKHVGKAVLLSTRAQGVFVIEPNIVEMAFMAEFRYNALAHLGGGYQTMLEKGIKYTMQPKNTATGEKAPLLK